MSSSPACDCFPFPFRFECDFEIDIDGDGSSGVDEGVTFEEEGYIKEEFGCFRGGIFGTAEFLGGEGLRVDMKDGTGGG